MKTQFDSRPAFDRSLAIAFVLFLVFCACILGLTGCVMPNLKKLDAAIPDGKWQQAVVEVSGKFTSTKLDAKGTKADGKWKDGELHFTHSNPWIVRATVDLKVKENE